MNVRAPTSFVIGSASTAASPAPIETGRSGSGRRYRSSPVSSTTFSLLASSEATARASADASME